MGAPYTFLNFALEDVLKAYLTTADSDLPNVLNIYRTCEAVAESQKIVEPFLTITCSDATPFAEVDARAQICNEMIACTLLIRTHASNDPQDGIVSDNVGRDFHAKCVGRIKDLLHDSELIAKLNSQGVPCIQVAQIDRPKTSTSPADRSYQTRITFDANVFPTLEA